MTADLDLSCWHLCLDRLPRGRFERGAIESGTTNKLFVLDMPRLSTPIGPRRSCIPPIGRYFEIRLSLRSMQPFPGGCGISSKLQ